MTLTSAQAEHASGPPGANNRINCLLVVGGQYHDFDFARLELLKLLFEDSNVRVRIFEDYAALAAIDEADFIVSYTCNVIPDTAQQQALRRFLAAGGRWYALHATNAILKFLESGVVDTPDLAPEFMQLLGSRFLSHPPVSTYRVSVTKREHELVRDVADFETLDELYLAERTGDLEVLLDTAYQGETPNFTASHWPPARHPVLYLRRVGRGDVLYLTLGHCRGRHDMRPFLEFWPTVDRGSWQLPVFYELLRRGIGWAKQAKKESGAKWT